MNAPHEFHGTSGDVTVPLSANRDRFVLVGLALAVLAILTDLPMIVLVLLTATAGAATLVAGAMLLAGSLNIADVDKHQGDPTDSGLTELVDHLRRGRGCRRRAADPGGGVDAAQPARAVGRRRRTPTNRR
jgi:hypothetical protein